MIFNLQSVRTSKMYAEIGKLFIRCSNFKNCKWIGKLSDYTLHMKSCTSGCPVCISSHQFYRKNNIYTSNNFGFFYSQTLKVKSTQDPASPTQVSEMNNLCIFNTILAHKCGSDAFFAGIKIENCQGCRDCG